MRITKQDRLKGIIFGCAVGDALGAPVEFLGLEVSKDIREVLARTGPQGVDRMLHYNCPDVSDQLGIGAVTDDTAMLACSAEAMTLTLKERIYSFEKQLLQNTHQSYLNWGAVQTGGEECRKYIEQDYVWSDSLRNLWFRCASGKGTVSALATGHMGSLEKPAYSTHRGSPQAVMGSGGMMRVAVLAALPDELVTDFFALGKKHAALTHADPVAYQGTGVVLQLAALLYRGMEINDAIRFTRERLAKEPNSADCLTYFDRGITTAIAEPDSRFKINWLIERENDPFMTGPILVQVMYVLASVEDISKKHSASDPNIMRYIFNLAVTHRGDTDSVGAIAGALTGAYYGFSKLPREWVNQLQSGASLNVVFDDLLESLDKFNLNKTVAKSV